VKRAVTSERAPKAIGPYSQAVLRQAQDERASELLFCSGQIGLDPATGELVAGGVRAESRRVMENLTAVLEAAGLAWPDVVKTTIYLADMADFALVNEVYAEFVREPFPARETVGVAALPRGARIEISVVASAAASRSTGSR
jgi:2-iminobutanoate/2-iminopropanoate deaminase